MANTSALPPTACAMLAPRCRCGWLPFPARPVAWRGYAHEALPVPGVEAMAQWVGMLASSRARAGAHVAEMAEMAAFDGVHPAKPKAAPVACHLAEQQREEAPDGVS